MEKSIGLPRIDLKRVPKKVLLIPAGIALVAALTGCGDVTHDGKCTATVVYKSPSGVTMTSHPQGTYDFQTGACKADY